jgi:hypothetical protein
VKTHSYLYCYNSLALQILSRRITDQEDDSTQNGYIPKFFALHDMPTTVRHAALADNYPDTQLNCAPDTAIVAAFRQIIALSQQYRCKLAVVISPVYFPLHTASSTIRTAANICAHEHIPFLDYSPSPQFTTDNELFDDATHLNDSGARKFTRVLSADLIAKGFP